MRRLWQTIPLDTDQKKQALPAFFSATDNRADAGLGVSAVIGTIDTVPTIRCRLNIDGWHQAIPVTRLFAGPGPFIDLIASDEHPGGNDP